MKNSTEELQARVRALRENPYDLDAWRDLLVAAERRGLFVVLDGRESWFKDRAWVFEVPDHYNRTDGPQLLVHKYGEKKASFLDPRTALDARVFKVTFVPPAKIEGEDAKANPPFAGFTQLVRHYYGQGLSVHEVAEKIGVYYVGDSQRQVSPSQVLYALRQSGIHVPESRMGKKANPDVDVRALVREARETLDPMIAARAALAIMRVQDNDPVVQVLRQAYYEKKRVRGLFRNDHLGTKEERTFYVGSNWASGERLVTPPVGLESRPGEIEERWLAKDFLGHAYVPAQPTRFVLPAKLMRTKVGKTWEGIARWWRGVEEGISVAKLRELNPTGGKGDLHGFKQGDAILVPPRAGEVVATLMATDARSAGPLGGGGGWTLHPHDIEWARIEEPKPRRPRAPRAARCELCGFRELSPGNARYCDACVCAECDEAAAEGDDLCERCAERRDSGAQANPRRKNPDEDLRRLERLAAQGDKAAAHKLLIERRRRLGVREFWAPAKRTFRRVRQRLQNYVHFAYTDPRNHNFNQVLVLREPRVVDGVNLPPAHEARNFVRFVHPDLKDTRLRVETVTGVNDPRVEVHAEGRGGQVVGVFRPARARDIYSDESIRREAARLEGLRQQHRWLYDRIGRAVAGAHDCDEGHCEIVAALRAGLCLYAAEALGASGIEGLGEVQAAVSEFTQVVGQEDADLLLTMETGDFARLPIIGCGSCGASTYDLELEDCSNCGASLEDDEDAGHP